VAKPSPPKDNSDNPDDWGRLGVRLTHRSWEITNWMQPIPCQSWKRFYGKVQSEVQKVDRLLQAKQHVGNHAYRISQWTVALCTKVYVCTGTIGQWIITWQQYDRPYGFRCFSSWHALICVCNITYWNMLHVPFLSPFIDDMTSRWSHVTPLMMILLGMLL
jgi:hypothetical protein